MDFTASMVSLSDILLMLLKGSEGQQCRQEGGNSNIGNDQDFGMRAVDESSRIEKGLTFA